MNPNNFNLAPISINARSALNLGSMSIQSPTPPYPRQFFSTSTTRQFSNYRLMPSPSWRGKNLINFLTTLSVQLSLEQGFSREKRNEIQRGRGEQRFNNDAFNRIRRRNKTIEGNGWFESMGGRRVCCKDR